MEIIISPAEIKKHRVSKYSFKPISTGGRVDEEAERIPVDEAIVPLSQAVEGAEAPPEEAGGEAPVVAPKPAAPPPVPEPMLRQDNALVEQLLKKIDELTDRVSGLSGQMQGQKEEFELRLEEEKKRAFEEGNTAGAQAKEKELLLQVEEGKERIAESVGKLEEAADHFLRGAAEMEKELVGVAIDMAQEVVAKEVELASSKIASTLAAKLLGEVKKASRATVRVHPKDLETVKSRLSKAKGVEVVGDGAVAPGGVVVMSDLGNINGEIATRFETMKKDLLENDKA